MLSCRQPGLRSWQLGPVELGSGLWEVEHLKEAPDLPCSFLRHLNAFMLPNWPWHWLVGPHRPSLLLSLVREQVDKELTSLGVCSLSREFPFC